MLQTNNLSIIVKNKKKSCDGTAESVILFEMLITTKITHLRLL